MSVPITAGKNFNYFKRVNVTNAAFSTNSDVEFAFRGDPSFTLINEGTGTVEYSFNGNTLAGDMIANGPSASLVFNNRGVKNIWFRLKSGAASAVRIEASATGTMSGGTSAGGGTVTSNSTITSPIGTALMATAVPVTLATNDTVFTTGTAQTQVKSGLKGASTAALVTSTANGVDHQGLDVVEQFAPVYEDNVNGVACTVIKPLAVSTYCWSVSQSAALEASRLAKASAGCLRSVTARLDSTAGTATYYVQFLNAASLPADGAVTHLCTPVKRIHTSGTDDYISVDFTDSCIAASTGIVIVLSTTEFTKTISTALLSVCVLYK